MRKRDPAKVARDFQAEVTASAHRLTASLSTTTERDERSTLCMDATMRLATAWEVFRSDWFIACITRDSSAMAAVVQSDVSKAIWASSYPRAKGAHNAAWIQIVVPKHPTLQQVADALDPKSYNLSLPSSIRDHWGLLAEPFASSVTQLPEADDRLIGLLVALRNAITHRSRSSIERLNDCLAKIDSTDAGFQQGGGNLRAAGVGRYLRATSHSELMSEKKARVLHLHDRTIEIAGRHS